MTDETLAGRIDIRPCRDGDADLLEEVATSPGTSRFHHRRLARQVAGEAVYLIAWLEGSPIGNLCLILAGPDNDEVASKLVAGPEINAFDVYPDWRDRGVGSALIAAAERMARERGDLGVVLGVEVSNDAARRLYERLGYRDWGRGESHDSYTWLDDNGDEHLQEEVAIWMEKRFSDG